MKRAKTATVALKTRMRETLRAKLEAAAKRKKVSLNSDLVGRVERSFANEDVLQALSDIERKLERIAELQELTLRHQAGIRKKSRG